MHNHTGFLQCLTDIDLSWANFVTKGNNETKLTIIVSKLAWKVWMTTVNMDEQGQYGCF